MALGSTQPLDRNKYQRHLLGGKGGWCVRLTTSPPSCANCHDVWEPQPPGTLRACPGLSKGLLYLSFSHLVAHLVEALRYKPEGRGFNS